MRGCARCRRGRASSASARRCGRRPRPRPRRSSGRRRRSRRSSGRRESRRRRAPARPPRPAAASVARRPGVGRGGSDVGMRPCPRFIGATTPTPEAGRSSRSRPVRASPLAGVLSAPPGPLPSWAPDAYPYRRNRRRRRPAAPRRRWGRLRVRPLPCGGDREGRPRRRSRRLGADARAGARQAAQRRARAAQPSGRRARAREALHAHARARRRRRRHRRLGERRDGAHARRQHPQPYPARSARRVARRRARARHRLRQARDRAAW